MFLSSLTSAQLHHLIELVKKKKTIQAKLAQVERSLDALQSGTTTKEKRDSLLKNWRLVSTPSPPVFQFGSIRPARKSRVSRRWGLRDLPMRGKSSSFRFVPHCTSKILF